MKFQLVEFYPILGKNKNKSQKDSVGTIHIYVIDCKLDLRGIMVSKKGKKMFFHFPHMSAIDEETKEKVRYPVVRFVDPKTHELLLDFLFKEVKPIILKKLCEIEKTDK